VHSRRISRLLVSLLVVLWAVPLWAQSVSLTILHTNDTHGHLRPFSYPSQPRDPELKGMETSRIGGIARRATVVNRIRSEMKKTGTTVWLMDAGDFSDGTAFSTEYHGEADVAAMNALGYDFGTLGNHEFNNPLAQLQKLIGLIRYPLVCANATMTATGKPLVPPSRVEQVGPMRIAVFGLITREAASYPAAKEGVTIAGELDTARQLVPELRKQADAVILISHAGKAMDEKLAAEVPGIDVIIGGHSHSRMPAVSWNDRAATVNAAGTYVNGTIIVQAYQWAGELGRLDVIFRKDPSGAWHVTPKDYRAGQIPIDEKIAPDPKVAAIVDKYWQPLASRYGQIIGRADGDFTDRGNDAAQYNLVADAVRETLGTDVEFENLGGVRAPLVSGPITHDDLVTMDPFNNTVVTFSLTGRDLLRILKTYAPAVSGVRYRLENGDLKDVTVGGKPVDENVTYTGASNSYFAGFALKGLEVKDTGRPRLEVLTNYVRKKGTVTPAYDGRRVVIRLPQ
jgi:5'-nucleotidase/UDP-sugar diphosphatase